MQLKARRPKYKYKNDEAWLRAVYRKNREYINSKLYGVSEKNKFKAFKNLVEERKDRKKETTYRAVRGVARALEPKNKFQENIYKAIKSDEDLMKQFRKEIGWKTKIDLQKFKWDYSDNTYSYGNVRIDVSNSPYGISIYTV